MQGTSQTWGSKVPVSISRSEDPDTYEKMLNKSISKAFNPTSYILRKIACVPTTTILGDSKGSSEITVLQHTWRLRFYGEEDALKFAPVIRRKVFSKLLIGMTLVISLARTLYPILTATLKFAGLTLFRVQ
jgi:hypothetical protein